jgi:hypothetical protein
MEHVVMFVRIQMQLQTVMLCLQHGRSQLSRGLRRRSAAKRLLGSWVRIPQGTPMFVSCECLCCEVEVSATGRSLVQGSPTDCCVFQCDQVKNRNLDTCCE